MSPLAYNDTELETATVPHLEYKVRGHKRRLWLNGVWDGAIDHWKGGEWQFERFARNADIVRAAKWLLKECQ